MIVFNLFEAGNPKNIRLIPVNNTVFISKDTIFPSFYLYSVNSSFWYILKSNKIRFTF